MTPTFSLLHATYMRPEKAIAAARMCFKRASNPEAIEHIFAVNEGDETRTKLCELAHDLAYGTGYLSRWKVQVIWGDYAGSAPAWDAAAKVSTGRILIQMQDDLEVPRNWDAVLLEWLEGANTDPNWWRTVPLVVTVRDGYRKDALLCTAIVNRLRYQQQGEFLHSGFLSVFSDDDFSYRCYRDERDGKCQVIRTDLEFRHEHHYHDPSVPMDATYARENSDEAYIKGRALFALRNPEAATDGLKTWK